MNLPGKRTLFAFGLLVVLILLSPIISAHQAPPRETSSAKEHTEDTSTLFEIIKEWTRLLLQRLDANRSDDVLLQQKSILMNAINNETDEGKKWQAIKDYDRVLAELEKTDLLMPYSDQQGMLLRSLNGVYGESTEPYLIKSIVEREMHLVAHKKNISELLLISLICDGLSIEIAHSCYRPLIVEISRNDQETVKETINLFKDRWLARDVEQCHFLVHEFGYALYDLYGLEGVNWCMDTYDECSYGCYHGTAQEFTLLNHAGGIDLILNSAEYQKILKSKFSFEIWSLHHGMGHALYELYRDLNKSFEDCAVLGVRNPSRTKSCYYGVSHEFSTYVYHQNMSLVEASKYCPTDTTRRRTCLYMLGHTYSARASAANAVSACSQLNDSSCFIGVAAVVGVKSDSLKNSEKICLALFPEEMLSFCYQGLAISYLYYDNDLNGAFDACTLDSQLRCYEYLKRVYLDDLWFKGALCDNVETAKYIECERMLPGVIRSKEEPDHERWT